MSLEEDPDCSKTSAASEKSKHHFHREIDVQSSSRLVSGHAQYSSRVDEQLFNLKELLNEIHETDVLYVDVTEEWIHRATQIRILLNMDNFDTAASHVNDVIDALQRVHLRVESARYSNTRQTYINSVLYIEHHIEVAVANLESFVEKKGKAKPGPMLCSGTAVAMLSRAEEAMLDPKIKRAGVVRVHHKLEKLRQKYVRAAEGQRDVFAPLVTRLNDITQEAYHAEETHDHATYIHLAHSIRKLRHIVLDYKKAGMFSKMDQSCEGSAAEKQGDSKVLEHFESDGEQATAEEEEGGNETGDGEVEPEMPDDLATDGLPNDLLDMSIRELVDAFVDAWRTIGTDVGLALYKMRTSKENDVRKLLMAFITSVFKTIIKVEHMVYVGVGLMLLSVVLYLLVSS